MALINTVAQMLGYVPRDAMAEAVRRLRKGRRSPQRVRAFDAGKSSELRFSFTQSSQSINADLYQSLDSLRARSRDLWANNEWMKRFSALVKSNIVGPNGVIFQSRAKQEDGSLDKGNAQIIEDHFEAWSEKGNFDVTGRLSRLDGEQLLSETGARDGEFLVRIIRSFPGNDFGYALEFLDIDRLDVQMNRERGRPAGANRILMGVELDGFQRPVAYWILNDHPNPYVPEARAQRHTRIPATDIIHGFISVRPEQLRGIPWAHAAILGLHDTGGYKEAAIVAARVGAAKMGFFKTDDAESGPFDAFDADGNLIMDAAEPGEFRNVPSDTELMEWNPTYPHEAFGDTLKWMLRGTAAGLGAAYHSLSQDLESVSFSSSRTGANEDRDHWASLQQWFIGQFHKALFPDFLRHQLFTGRLAPIPADKMERVLPANWMPRRWGNFDPLKDEQGNALAFGMRTKSLSQIIRDRGFDPDVVFQELSDDMEKLRDLGIEPTLPTQFQLEGAEAAPTGGDDE